MWARFVTRVIEIAINSTNIASKSGFRWTTDFNISFIRNELRALAGGAKEMQTSASWNGDYTGYDYTARVGQSLGLIYGYVFDGVYQTSVSMSTPRRVSICSKRVSPTFRTMPECP